MKETNATTDITIWQEKSLRVLLTTIWLDDDNLFPIEVSYPHEIIIIGNELGPNIEMRSINTSFLL